MIPKETNTIRFAAGSPNAPKSLVWRLWVLGDNVFLGAKNGEQVFKVSLRDNGKWRIANTKALNQNDRQDDDIILEWDKNGETAPNWTHVITLIISSIKTVNSAVKNKAEDERIIFIDEPRDDRHIILKLLISSAEMKKYDLGKILNDGEKLIDSVKKQNGEKVWLVYREGILSSAQMDIVKEYQNGDNALLVTGGDGVSAGDEPAIFDIA